MNITDDSFIAVRMEFPFKAYPPDFPFSQKSWNELQILHFEYCRTAPPKMTKTVSYVNPAKSNSGVSNGASSGNSRGL